ncbi:guanine nucleotide-binding protein G(I)/G(S)/G(O) subunit gamma-10-like, partial [Cyanistes caeruleus]|uniref:guanine nucleotide-binding protein G(I)/G(S)/G(O) subunit gamma-10-like n=1 Tax=Cyanistes caeruleus TaxID=156563 RepID=UPI000CDAEC88
FPLWIFFPFQVSQAAAELQQYCMQNACKDALLVGVPAGSNPFREPRSCALL